MSRAKTFVVSLLVLAAFGGTVMLLQDGDIKLPLPDITLQSPTAAPDAPAASGLVGGPAGAPVPYTGVADIVERVTPAVVNIQVKAESEAADLPPALRDPRFRRFFGVPDELPKQERSSVGSGVIVDAKQGYVLTNFHVVDKATDIAVTLKDRRTFTATVVGKDQATDLALLKIEADNLTALPLGDMSQMQVGDYVLAVGNPFGLGQTVTSGIISAMGRAGFIDQGYEDFIQTDAAINPGNSGGALVNLKGELIGTPTVIIGPGANIGIGFAVPVSIASNVMDQLIQNGEVSRGRIGVAIRDVTPELAQNLGLTTNRGALVNSVEPGSPADKAGIEAGDVIVTLDGTPVEGSANVRNRVGLVKPGTSVKVGVVRDGKDREFELAVEKASPAQQAAAAPEPAEPSQVMGAILENTPEGVRVREVAENSPAAAIDLREGDLITAVNRKPVKTAAQLEELLGTAKSQTVLFLKREDREMVLVLP